MKIHTHPSCSPLPAFSWYNPEFSTQISSPTPNASMQRFWDCRPSLHFAGCLTLGLFQTLHSAQWIGKSGCSSWTVVARISLRRVDVTLGGCSSTLRLSSDRLRMNCGADLPRLSAWCHWWNLVLLWSRSKGYRNGLLAEPVIRIDLARLSACWRTSDLCVDRERLELEGGMRKSG